MSPTLTAPKSASTAHDNPAASPKSTTAAKPAKPRSSKPSALSRFFRLLLLPCTGPSSAHPVELDLNPSQSTPEPSPTIKQEKQVAAVEEEQLPAPLASASSPVPQQLETEQSAEEAPPIPEKVEEETQEVEVLTPPSPTLLPEVETEGLTSGAVQPPGSTGVPPTPERPSVHGDGNESDRTSFTEDDDLNDVDIDEEDDEDKLILNGGAGIPIGPVRTSPFSERAFSSPITMNFQDGVPRPLLPPIAPIHAGRKCLVLDLDETLVHSSFKVRRSALPQNVYLTALHSRYPRPTMSCPSRSSITGTMCMSSSVLASTTS
jgi:RNA polymerase II subunit A small phosphatase-like protein